MIKFRITILLTVLTSMFGVKALAHDIAVKNKDGITINYNWINDQTELEVARTFIWSSCEVVIPESVEYEGKNYNVTSIGEYAFAECSGITAVTIPNSVISINKYAFEECKGLLSITIPNSVFYIGEGAFDYCVKMKRVMIGSGLTNLEEAFSGCSLETIIVDKDNPNYDSRDNCNAIIETPTNRLVLGCDNTIIPNSVTTIGARSFSGCNFASLNIPNGVNTIILQAFSDAHITSLTISGSVTKIESLAFQGADVGSIVVEEGNPIYDSRDNCNAVIETASNSIIVGCKNTVFPSSVTSIGLGAFSGYDQSTITIPNHITTLEQEAFWGSELTSVIIGNGVKIIGDAAFGYCEKLASVTIPENVTTIGIISFLGCRELTSVTIGKNVISIGDGSFYDCEKLKDVYCYAEEVPIVDVWYVNPMNGIFDSNSAGNATLHVPAGSIDAYKASDDWNGFKEIVAIEEETTEDMIKITSAGQTTWCSAYDLDFTGIEGIKAYTAGGYDRVSGTIWLMRVNQVPANEGILIIGTPGDYKVPHKTTGTYYANLMKGTLQPITIYETEGEYTNYYLSNGDSGVGFYKVNGSVALKANRAYLPLLKGTTQAGTRFIGLGFEDDGTTNLTPALSKGEGEGAWYTLQGQRVAKPGKGIYIRNGKKVVIK